MAELPEHTRSLIERLLEQYCARICPPAARQVINIGYHIAGTAVFLEEHRRICGVPGTRRSIPLARLRYRSIDGYWTLEHRSSQGSWRRHPSLVPTRHFLELLREFDADPLGLFWSHLDGKNLRWCSARGRCQGCEWRYAQILGLSAPAERPQG